MKKKTKKRKKSPQLNKETAENKKKKPTLVSGKIYDHLMFLTLYIHTHTYTYYYTLMYLENEAVDEKGIFEMPVILPTKGKDSKGVRKTMEWKIKFQKIAV